MSFEDLKREFLEHLEAFLSVVLILFFDTLTTVAVVSCLLGLAWIVKVLIQRDPFEYRDLLTFLHYFDQGVLAAALLILTGRFMKGLILRLYRNPPER
jgi:hypothetical protein